MNYTTEYCFNNCNGGETAVKKTLTLSVAIFITATKNKEKKLTKDYSDGEWRWRFWTCEGSNFSLTATPFITS